MTTQSRYSSARIALGPRLFRIGFVLIGLLPIWSGLFPAIYDYQAHLLEAQIAFDMARGGTAYSAGFVPRPGWMADSNALATLAKVGLLQLVPIDWAGRLVLSLILAIFLSGWQRLLERAGSASALLPLGLLLAYNFTFTSGWINFSLALALALCALYTYHAWHEQQQVPYLIWLAVLCILIFSAHLVIWGLLAITLGIRAAVDRLQPRRLLALALVGGVVLPLVFLAGRPMLAVIVLIGPLSWCGAWLLGRLRLPIWLLVGGAPVTAIMLFVAAQQALPLLQTFDPELRFHRFARLTFSLRTFTLAQQMPTPDPLLSALNTLLVMLLGFLGGCLAWAAWRADDGTTWQRLAPLGAIIVLYGAVPSFAADIAVVEPRLVIWGALLALTAIRLPEQGRLRRGIATLSLTIGLVGIGAFSAHTVRFQPQAEAWRTAMASMRPAESILVLPRPTPLSAASALRYIESYYDGLYFSARYPLEYGGATTRMFGNGPVYVRPDLELAEYFWRPARGAAPLPEACPHTQKRFGAVLAWGPLEAAQQAELNACFGPGQEQAGLTIWRNE